MKLFSVCDPNPLRFLSCVSRIMPFQQVHSDTILSLFFFLYAGITAHTKTEKEVNNEKLCNCRY